MNGQAITYAQLIKDTADYELVSPLINSLLCELPTPEVPKEIEMMIRYREYKEMLTNIPKEKNIRKKSKKILKKILLG